MTATRASLKRIGNIFPIALSLLIAACGGGGGGGGADVTPAPSSGGEWRGLITYKGTLRSGLYSYEEGKAVVAFQYSSADSDAFRNVFSIPRGTVTGMIEGGGFDPLTSAPCVFVASSVLSVPINNINFNYGYLDFNYDFPPPTYNGAVSSTTSGTVAFTTTCPSLPPPTPGYVTLGWFTTDLENYDGSDNIFGTFTVDSGGFGGITWEWNLTHYDTVSSGSIVGIGEIYTSNVSGNFITVHDRLASGNVAPVRTISGAATGLSFPQGVAVDLGHNEIIAANYSGNSIKVYARTASGNVSPLRTIMGASTGLNGPANIAVDTTNDEIVVANYGNNSIAVFSRTASGNVAPLRSIAGLATGLNRPADIEVDAGSDEIIAANLFGNSIAVFSRTASGNVSPLRTISGSSTGLSDPDGIAVDTMHNEIFVANGDNVIRVYGRTAGGNVAPLRTISGASTALISPLDIAVDTMNNEIIVANGDNAIRVYGRTASGNVAPLRTISGAATGLSGPWGIALLN